MPNTLLKLIKKAKKGDKNAFGDIYSLYLTRIYRFTYYLVYNEAQAEDITQDVFLKAWQYLPKFSVKRGTIQAFLYTIARNLVIDYRRKKKEVKLQTPMVMSLASRENVEEGYLDGEKKNIVHEALGELKKDESELIILRYFEELSFAEIAEIVKGNEGSLRVKIHRVLKKLKDQIQRKNL